MISKRKGQSNTKVPNQPNDLDLLQLSPNTPKNMLKRKQLDIKSAQTPSPQQQKSRKISKTPSSVVKIPNHPNHTSSSLDTDMPIDTSGMIGGFGDSYDKRFQAVGDILDNAVDAALRIKDCDCDSCKERSNVALAEASLSSSSSSSTSTSSTSQTNKAAVVEAMSSSSSSSSSSTSTASSSCSSSSSIPPSSLPHAQIDIHSENGLVTIANTSLYPIPSMRQVMTMFGSKKKICNKSVGQNGIGLKQAVANLSSQSIIMSISNNCFGLCLADIELMGRKNKPKLPKLKEEGEQFLDLNDLHLRARSIINNSFGKEPDCKGVFLSFGKIACMKKRRVGDHIEANPNQKWTEHQPATISNVCVDGTFNITFDDGVFSKSVHENEILGNVEDNEDDNEDDDDDDDDGDKNNQKEMNEEELCAKGMDYLVSLIHRYIRFHEESNTKHSFEVILVQVQKPESIFNRDQINHLVRNHFSFFLLQHLLIDTY